MTEEIKEIKIADKDTIELLKLHRALAIAETQLFQTDQYAKMKAAQMAFNTKLSAVALDVKSDPTKYTFNLDDMCFKLIEQPQG